MKQTLEKLLDLLEAKDKRKILLIFALMLINGLFELVGIASIMPFIAVLASPDIVQTNKYLNAFYVAFNFTDTNSFLIALGVLSFVTVVTSMGVRLLTLWVTTRFIQFWIYGLSLRLLEGYLSRPYSFFLNRHSADISKNLLSEVNQVAAKILSPMMDIGVNAVVAVSVISLIIVVNPVVALVVFCAIGGAYFTTFYLIREYVSRTGAKRVNATRKRFKLVQECFSAVKDLKVNGLERAYLMRFQRPSAKIVNIMTRQAVISAFPKHIIQAVVFGVVILLLIILLITKGNDLGQVLPLMALYAMSASRLNNAAQMLYRSFTAIRFGSPALDILYEDVDKSAMEAKLADEESDERLPLDQKFSLENVTYTYPNAEKPALTDLSLTIPAYSTVGFVGDTGAGKTTTVDVVLGLLRPQSGDVCVDGVPLDQDSVRSWQRNLGYVPQEIFLADMSIAENIALGVAKSKIDLEAVERAARIAELHSFVTEQLPEGYDTLVGERGVRLSGGQRQRVGIARALYPNPAILVLDEATSALDNLTERAIMDTVHNLAHKKTILIIAHRLTTVRRCDTIFLLEQGRLQASGTFDELVAKDSKFGLMAAGIA